MALNNIASGYGIDVECHKNDLLAREYNYLLFWAGWCISTVLQNRKKKKRERRREMENDKKKKHALPKYVKVHMD